MSICGNLLGMELAPLFVLAGPTAVGKGTVVKELIARYPELRVSISVTTRPPRPTEVDGRDYFFVSEEEFDRLIQADELLEWALVHKKYRYGTPARWVQHQRELGHPVLLELDLNGARQVKNRMHDCFMIFLLPPSWEELKRRLIGRGTEGPEERKRRLETAKTELAAQSEFDSVIVNADVHSTVQELAQELGLN